MLFLYLLLGIASINILNLIFTQKGAGKLKDKHKDGESISSSSFLFGRTTAGRNINEFTAMQMTPLVDWLKITENSENAKYLPSDVSYELANFEEFMEKRQKLMSKALKDILL